MKAKIEKIQVIMQGGEALNLARTILKVNEIIDLLNSEEDEAVT